MLPISSTGGGGGGRAGSLGLSLGFGGSSSSSSHHHSSVRGSLSSILSGGGIGSTLAGAGGGGGNGSSSSGSGGGRGGRRLWLFFRRFGRVGQMDFEVAVWQMMWLLVSPKRVYRSVYYHKQTKNQWARDDPAFLVILLAALILAAVAYSLSFGSSVLDTFKLILSFTFIDFIIPGVLIATVAWWVSNRFLRVQSVHSVEQSVEWGYAFDIHCNSFIPVFIVLYLLQFFFMPLLLKDNFFATFLGNTMYLVAFIYYTYITFLGYNALPFLHRTVVFLYPVLFYFVFYVVSLFLVNISRFVLGLYFPV